MPIKILLQPSLLLWLFTYESILWNYWKVVEPSEGGIVWGKIQRVLLFSIPADGFHTITTVALNALCDDAFAAAIRKFWGAIHLIQLSDDGHLNHWQNCVLLQYRCKWHNKFLLPSKTDSSPNSATLGSASRIPRLQQ